MAKIRGIKPEFWTDEEIVELSIPARLLFIGMWNFACDNGHLADKPKQIKMRVLPADDVNVAELLRELTSCNRVTRENGVITVIGLTRHQRVDKRYFTTCDAPGCTAPEPDSQHRSRREPAVPTKGTRRAPKGRSRGARVDGDGDGDIPPTPRRARRAASSPSTSSPDGSGERGQAPPQTPRHLERFEEFWNAYPRKEGQATALAAWAAATRDHEADAILDGLTRATPGWRDTEPRFIPKPSNWLRDQRWLDAPSEVAADPWAHLPVLNPRPADWTPNATSERTSL